MMITNSEILEIEEEWVSLGEAVVLQAIEDYRLSLKVLRKKPDHREAGRLLNDVRRFFRSGWFRRLYDIDPEVLMDRLKTRS